MITDEKLARIEADEGEASYDDIAAIIARLRKAEALAAYQTDRANRANEAAVDAITNAHEKLANAIAHKARLQAALEAIRNEDEDRFKDGVPSLSLRSRARIDEVLRATQ